MRENCLIERIELIKMSIDEGLGFVMDKLERSYNKMSEKGKMLVKMQYETAKNILK